MLGFGLYSSRTEDRVVLVIVLELSFNRRKLSLGRLGRLVGSFSSLLYIVLLLCRSGRTSHSSTGRSKTCSSRQARRGRLFSSFSNGLFRSCGSYLSLVCSLLLSEFSLNRLNALNGSLSGLSGRNGLSLDSGALQQEALTGGLAVRHTQVGCVNLQAVT